MNFFREEIIKFKFRSQETKGEPNCIFWLNLFYLFPLTKECEFHFENGNIRDWIKTGSAFDNQPTFGDNPTARNRGQPANQQGDWWIGTFEDHPCPKGKAGYIQGDGPTGTLTSPEFKIVGEQISFLIGGGCGDNPSNYAQLIVEGKVRIKPRFQFPFSSFRQEGSGRDFG